MPHAHTPTELIFTRSSFSGGGNCVEVAHSGDTVYVRNSRRPEHMIGFSARSWAALTEAVRRGERWCVTAAPRRSP